MGGKGAGGGRAVMGRTLDEHKGLAVSAEGVLEKEGQLAVSERNMLLLRNQSCHHITERAQTLVNVLCFFEPVAGRA